MLNLKYVKQKQQGVALITVLGMLIIMTVLIGAIAAVLHTNIKSTGSVLNATQLQWYAYSAENLVKQKIKQDAQFNADADSQSDALFAPMPPFNVGKATVQITIKDATGCINVNNIWQNGVVNAEINSWLGQWFTQHQISSIAADALVDWIDGNNTLISAHGAEQSYYSGLAQKGNIANQWVYSINELQQIRGFEPLQNKELWQRFSAGLCALPSFSPVNINFASAAVLASLDNNIDNTTLEQWLLQKQQSKQAIKSVDELWQSSAFKNATLDKTKYSKLLAVQSYFIQANINVTMNQQTIQLQSLIYKNTQNPIIVARDWVQ